MTISSRNVAVAGLCALAVAAGCVSVEQAPVGKDVLQKGQRAVVVVYAGPTAYVGQEETKGDTAASLIPGLALAAAGITDDKALAASKELQQYVPASFDPLASFQTPLMTELAKTPAKGTWVTASDAGLTPDQLRPLNASDSIIDWRHKYFDYNYTYEKPARDYSKFLNIDDALVFEVNLQYGLTVGDSDVATPNVTAIAHLYNADSMKLLWSDQETSEDQPGAKTRYDYESAPQDLVARWQALAPQVAHSIAAAFSNSVMGKSALPSGIDTSPMTSFSTATANGLPTPSATGQPGQVGSAQLGQPAQPGQIGQPGQSGIIGAGGNGQPQPGSPVFAQPAQPAAAPATTFPTPSQ